jgi:cytochrome c553
MSLKNMKKIVFFAVLAALSAAALAQVPAAPAKGDPAAGKAKAVAICSGCHGNVGTKVAYPEVYYVPKLGGQNEAYIVAALTGYRSGNRYNETMKGLALALSEKEVVDIAAYYSQK